MMLAGRLLVTKLCRPLTQRPSFRQGGRAAAAALRFIVSTAKGKAWMVKGSVIGDLGGSSCEHPRRWLGSQWLGLALGVPSCLEPPDAP